MSLRYDTTTPNYIPEMADAMLAKLRAAAETVAKNFMMLRFVLVFCDVKILVWWSDVNVS
jgi:hypothetical protein